MSTPTPSINAIKWSFSFLLGFPPPFIVARVVSHVEALLHQSFTIVGVGWGWSVVYAGNG
jgi:hypothetical protein